MLTNFTPKTYKYSCVGCGMTTNNKKDYSKHLLTAKHSKNSDSTHLLTKKTPNTPTLECSKCHKMYKSRTGLWLHNKKCTVQIQSFIKDNDSIIELFILQMQENKEMQQIIIEQNKQIMELSKNTGIVINNTTHQKFNLNFFLNEQCKDALNISDFVNSLCLQLADLEMVAKNGFVNGISQIFVNGLKELDIYKRPIHCSDFKRDILYIKDEDRWEKENLEKEIITKAIKTIAHKNVKQIPIWMKENPNCKDVNSQKNNEYLHLVSNLMSGSTQQEEIDNVKGIIKNISKEVMIDK